VSEVEPAGAPAPELEIDLLTVHPELVRSPLDHSILARARASGRVRVDVHDIREHAPGRHRQVDDTPYGGGPGMVMKVDVVRAAIDAVRRPDSLVLLTDPGGARLDQRRAARLARLAHLVLVCGHYEGIDDRIRRYIDGAISIGDFVLTGGELAALVVIDAVVRLVPGVLGNPESAVEESFGGAGGARRLEHPQYTRPRVYDGVEVPAVLLSGNHAAIADWRAAQALERTRRLRPDLLEIAEE
jgi:tRNA (guanine37-N1)-methyltransferase